MEDQNKWYDKYKNNNKDIMFIIYSENMPVGTVALYDIDYKNNTAEFGRLLIGDLNSRRKNIGFIATKALCEYGFNNLGLIKLFLKCIKKILRHLIFIKVLDLKLLRK